MARKPSGLQKLDEENGRDFVYAILGDQYLLNAGENKRKREVEHQAAAVSRNLGRSLPAHKFAALVSFSFSLPWNRFMSSYLFKWAKDDALHWRVGPEFTKFATKDGVWDPVLEEKRTAEAMLWEYGFEHTIRIDNK